MLAAHREDHPHHRSVRAWLDALLAAGGQFAVPLLVWGSFLRLASNRRIFEVPTPRRDTFAFIDAIVAQPGHLLVAPGPRHLDLLRALCDEADALGDLVPDAVVAAVAAEHSCQVVTLDRDFARFASVQHRRPCGRLIASIAETIASTRSRTAPVVRDRRLGVSRARCRSTCATMSHMEVGVRELRNNTADVIAAVESGERVTLTVRGNPVADIVPHGRRTRWLDGNRLATELTERSADSALSDDLAELAGQTIDRL